MVETQIKTRLRGAPTDVGPRPFKHQKGSRPARGSIRLRPRRKEGGKDVKNSNRKETRTNTRERRTVPPLKLTHDFAGAPAARRIPRGLSLWPNSPWARPPSFRKSRRRRARRDKEHRATACDNRAGRGGRLRTPCRPRRAVASLSPRPRDQPGVAAVPWRVRVMSRTDELGTWRSRERTGATCRN